MKRLIFILTAIIALTASAAGNADALLGRAADKLRASKSVTACFTLAVGGESTTGNITLAGDRFVVKTPQLSTWYDGKTQWSYSPQAGEVNITEPTADELSQVNPFVIINAFRKGYKSTLGASTAATKVINLAALDKRADIRTVVLTLDTKTLYPTKIVMTLADGRKMTVTVSSVTPGKALPASTFVFDKKKYPGAEIVDLR